MKKKIVWNQIRIEYSWSYADWKEYRPIWNYKWCPDRPFIDTRPGKMRKGRSKLAVRIGGKIINPAQLGFPKVAYGRLTSTDRPTWEIAVVVVVTVVVVVVAVVVKSTKISTKLNISFFQVFYFRFTFLTISVIPAQSSASRYVSVFPVLALLSVFVWKLLKLVISENKNTLIIFDIRSSNRD